MSMVYPNPAVEVQEQFVLSATVGIAIIEVLKELKIKRLKLKWPNDIMSANFKIGGVLIENILNNGRITASIIGIGLNLNQLIFPHLPKAASLKSLTGKDFDVEKVLDKIVTRLEMKLDDLKKADKQDILGDYETQLFKKDKVSTFQLEDGELLTGIIRGITSTGLLKLEVEDEIMRFFDLKELKLLF